MIFFCVEMDKKHKNEFEKRLKGFCRESLKNGEIRKIILFIILKNNCVTREIQDTKIKER